jgi:hypothetical protein
MSHAKLLPLVACLTALAAVGCAKKGPAERVGEKVDHSVDTLRNGGEEPTQDKLQDEADKARDKAADAADNAKNGN